MTPEFIQHMIAHARPERCAFCGDHIPPHATVCLACQRELDTYASGPEEQRNALLAERLTLEEQLIRLHVVRASVSERYFHERRHEFTDRLVRIDRALTELELEIPEGGAGSRTGGAHAKL